MTLWNSLDLLNLCMKDKQTPSSVESPWWEHTSIMLASSFHVLTYSWTLCSQSILLSTCSLSNSSSLASTHAHYLLNPILPHSCLPFSQSRICSLSIFSNLHLLTHAHSSTQLFSAHSCSLIIGSSLCSLIICSTFYLLPHAVSS